MLNFCGGTWGRCLTWLTNQPADNVALIILGCFITLFIILRIFFWFFKDFDIW